MRFVRADVPDTRILRRHHCQTSFYGVGIIPIRNVNGIQSMRDRHADHGVSQPLDIVHIAGD
ncbi:hypothetical protein D3C78_1744980 [compost metagenome]